MLPKATLLPPRPLENLCIHPKSPKTRSTKNTQSSRWISPSCFPQTWRWAFNAWAFELRWHMHFWLKSGHQLKHL